MSIPEVAFLRCSQIIGHPKKGIRPLIPISRSTLWAWVKVGRFPAPIKCGPNTTVWRATDVSEFLKRHAEELNDAA